MRKVEPTSKSDTADVMTAAAVRVTLRRKPATVSRKA
jgi:hypothetical protein